VSGLTDWQEWHEEYADPASGLSRRRRTVRDTQCLMAPGAAVLWTRGSFETDLAPVIAGWFEESGFERTSYHADDDHGHRVVEHRLVTEPRPFRPGERLFTFVR
jgi:hypothetical protein